MILPIVLRLPSMVFSVPPLMILTPTTFPFGVQIPPAVVGLAAVLAAVVDSFVQSRFRFFDCMLALRSVIGVHGGGCYKQQERPHHYGCDGCFSSS